MLSYNSYNKDIQTDAETHRTTSEGLLRHKELQHPTEEDREDRCTGSYRQAVGLFPILVSVIMLILIYNN